jgi:hypothetical protein
MTHKDYAPFARRPTAAVFSFTVSPNSLALSYDARTGNPCPGVPKPDPKSRYPTMKLHIPAFLERHVQSAWRSMLALLRSVPTQQSKQNPWKSRVLMCFSRLGGHWYRVFFDEGALHTRLPHRLTYRDVAKVYEAARRGHAHLEDAAARQDFESAPASGRGKIWLYLTCEQRTALDQTVAV